jgi:molecular chaperone DnaJ
MVLRIPMTAAALGTEIQIATLEADLADADAEDVSATITVPPGTQSGTRVALDGRGVPRLRSHGRGQLGVTLLVQTPTRLDAEQRDLLGQLARLREETSVQGAVQKHGGQGFFGRLRDAFAGQ